MNEGYLILNATKDNTTEISLLIRSIKRQDPDRGVSVAVIDSSNFNFAEADQIISVNEENPTLNYFKSLLASPYDKTIALLPDQVLTIFNPAIWENLRSMDPIILPKHRYSFNGSIIDPSVYTAANTELKNFGLNSVSNAIFLNRDKGADDVLGLAVILCANYDQDDYINFFIDQEHSMPSFPKYVWPSWILSLIQSITDCKISTFDFMHCIDLSSQENNFVNSYWSKKWCEFLTYWVNGIGTLKIENFVQHGLVKYETAGWLTEEVLTNFKMND